MKGLTRRAALAAGAASAFAHSAPAIAQGSPTLRWRLTSSFPKSLDTIFGAAEHLAKRVAEATDNRFQIQVFAAGEIVGGLQALDAVQSGTVEMASTAAYYFIGKDPTLAFATGVPFGLNTRLQNSWMYHGGGADLTAEVFRTFNVVAIPMGNTGAQMGGWFRRKLGGVGDLNGLKFRIGGLGGQVLARLGVVPQQIAGGDVYPALERGTIDAAEWIGAYDDEKLGFNKVAPFYYYPGFWEGGSMMHLLVNQDRWNELPKAYQTLLHTAASDANHVMLAKYDTLNPVALRRLVGAGTQLQPFPRDVLDAAYEAAFALYDKLASENDRFRKVYEGWRHFRNEASLWARVAEAPFDNYVLARVGR